MNKVVNVCRAFVGRVPYVWHTMNEKEMLKMLFEFETYCTARFDSQARVALAVYDYVKQMKSRYTSGLNPTQ